MSLTINKPPKIVGVSSGAGPAPAIPSVQSDLIQDAVFTTDLEGMITSCNSSVSRYGHAPKDLIGKNLAVLFSAESKALFTKLVVPAAVEKGRSEAQLRGWVKGGEEFCVHLRLTLVQDAGSNPIGMVGVAVDMPEIKSSGSLPLSGQKQRAQLWPGAS